MTTYRSLRGTRRPRYRARRSRKEALPQALIFMFGLSAVMFAVYQLRAPSRNAPERAHQVTRAAIMAPTTPATPVELDLNPLLRSGSSYGDLCTGDKFFANRLTLLLLIPAVVFCFVGLAIITDDFFVVALERICERLKLSEDVAGATFMAAGSSTPEFFASLLGVFVTKDEIGIGTIVGSAVFNILVIIGLSAALAGAVLKLDWRPLARDSFFYVISIILLLLFTVASTPGRINWWEGLILFSTYGVYVLFMAYGNKSYMNFAQRHLMRAPAEDALEEMERGQEQADGDDPLASGHDDSDEMRRFNETAARVRDAATQKIEYSKLNPRARFRALQNAVMVMNYLVSSSSDENSERHGSEPWTPPPAARTADDDEERRADNVENDPEGNDDADEEGVRTFLGVDLPSSVIGWLFLPFTMPWHLLFRVIVDCSQDDKAHLWWVTFGEAIIFISGISYVMVEGARIAGCLVGIPAPAMGLTVLAAGTSVPDALASISVARAGSADMAVSNAIGSNVFDILLGLGFPWFLGDLILDEIRIPISPLSTVIIPIAILFGIMVLFVVLLVLLRWELRPLLGILLFAAYGLFVAYTLLDVFVFSA